MNKIPYYPGCTLTNTAKNFDRSARESMKALDWELDELPRWNCCGTVYSLASDNLINHVGPVRLLTHTQELGQNRMTTLCSMCFHTLKLANDLVRQDRDKLEKINFFMKDKDTDPEYKGQVEVVHLLEILRDEVTFAAVKAKTTKPLKGLKLVPYYGCLLTRPKQVAIDNVEQPTVMGDMITALGGESLYDPFLTECCGSYHTVMDKDVVVDKADRILTSAKKKGGEAIITSCPLCFFNLDARQKDIKEKLGKSIDMPVFYFTQLMALALGLSPEVCLFDLHAVDPRPLLKAKGII
ncbi:MAG: CoB--CoM heterodisulfide reductase iron-sulfur subunit B family protein [bacterium]|nr:CoB--CoM heterodisulfide reductase iron-sulfur subunit B family protein [bacterium]